jgi:predicted esterase
MLRLTALLGLVLVAISPSSFAQGKEDYNALNQKAIDALQAKKYDEGVGILMHMLEIVPKSKSTAYNLACAYSLKGDVDKAFEWLDKGIEWGWGTGQGQIFGDSKPTGEIEMVKTDKDLEAMRKDPRFDKLIERMGKAGEVRKAKLKKGEEYSATAATYLPEKVAGLKEMPVLVVLHDTGSTKDEVVKGRWKAIADELGFALIAPSGKFLVGEEPAKGMAWFETMDEYTAKPSIYEMSVNDAVTTFQKSHPIDKTRVVVAGEGIGGLVALDVAINSPAIYKAVVSLNGRFNPQLYAGKAPTAGKMGLKVALLLDSAKLGKEAEPEGGLEKIVAAENRSLQTWGLSGEAKAFAPDPKDADQKQLLVEAVRSVLTATAAPAGGAGAAPK